ncbi:MAG: hypothetical protein H7Z37_07200 [Pyrinomonadaceae bacterium]|nr:hypothetical protein [Pyrinomonadaceae bacterium]
MQNWIEERAAKYRNHFGFGDDVELIPHGCNVEIKPETEAKLKQFNIEWHFIPDAQSVPFDEAYLRRFYPTSSNLFGKTQGHEKNVREMLKKGHERQQGYVVGVETTQKPIYLPRNKQFYGTTYGHDASRDPLRKYFGQVGMTNGTRFDQNYPMLRRLFDTLNEDWRKREMLPEGFRVTVCPPAIFNLIGTVFHPEWSKTESLELGFYRDERGNATCFGVGANDENDFSHVDIIEGEEWSQTGFRLALMCDETRHDAK